MRFETQDKTMDFNVCLIEISIMCIMMKILIVHQKEIKSRAVMYLFLIFLS